jgi:hypothetical protein
VTHIYIQTIKQPTLHYLTRSVRRTSGYVQTRLSPLTPDCRQSGSNPADISKDPGCCGGQTGRNARPTLLQFADPDVAVADWVIVILQRQREFFWAGGVGRPHVVAGGAG